MNQTTLITLLMLLMLPLRASAQAATTIDQITDPRQKLTFIKRNSRLYYFREARYGEVICPRDTALLVVYTEFLIDANDRRMQNGLPQIDEAQIRQMVSQLDVNYGNYNRIMIYCDRTQVIPPAAPAVAVATDAPVATAATAAAAAPDAPASSVDPPLPADILSELSGIESYTDFVGILQELKGEQKISIMGMISSDTAAELREHYIAAFQRSTNTLKAIVEPLTDGTHRNVATGQKEDISAYPQADYKRIYFK
jgi:hypothetical protein